MGKEIRGGLSVVGALLVAFCVLLYARLVRGPSGPPPASIESKEGHSDQLTRTQRKLRGPPTIVKPRPTDPYGSADDPSGRLDNPRDDHHRADPDYQDWQDREHRFLPIAPAPLGDDFVSTDSGPDATPPSSTMSVSVQMDETIEQLAERLYGSGDYERALWQWLFDRKRVEHVQPGVTVELPTRAALRRTHPELVPVESR